MREEDGWWFKSRKKRNNRAEGRVKARWMVPILLPLLSWAGPAMKTHRPALPLGTITPFQSEQAQKGQQVQQDRCRHTKDCCWEYSQSKHRVRSGYWATTTDSERHSRTPEAQSRLISMSARGRLPTSNTFELIRKWKLVKEEEEKQQQKVKVRWTVPTLLPRLSLAGLEDP
jgi:hypothetical protein